MPADTTAANPARRVTPPSGCVCSGAVSAQQYVRVAHHVATMTGLWGQCFAWVLAMVQAAILVTIMSSGMAGFLHPDGPVAGLSWQQLTLAVPAALLVALYIVALVTRGICYMRNTVLLIVIGLDILCAVLLAVGVSVLGYCLLQAHALLVPPPDAPPADWDTWIHSLRTPGAIATGFCALQALRIAVLLWYRWRLDAAVPDTFALGGQAGSSRATTAATFMKQQASGASCASLLPGGGALSGANSCAKWWRRLVSRCAGSTALPSGVTKRPVRLEGDSGDLADFDDDFDGVVVLDEHDEEPVQPARDDSDSHRA